jgi:hypothetical protein
MPGMDRHAAMIWRLLTLLLLGQLCAPVAMAAPPDNTPVDPTLRRWYEQLRQPGSGMLCCSISDCRTRNYRQQDDRYEVEIDGGWFGVPANTVLRDTANPTQKAVVCYTRKPDRAGTPEILCFIPPELRS